MTDPLSLTTLFGYDAANQLSTVTRPNSTLLRTSYDSNGNVLSTTAPLSHTTTYTYDSLNRLIALTDPLTRTTSYGYDLAGNLTGTTTALTQTTGYSYDAANRLTTLTQPDGTLLQRPTTPTATRSHRPTRSACSFCFPAGTLVATPHGEQPIQTLHVGEVMLAEDPTTTHVDQEHVQAVIVDPVKPLIAVALSDGSTITVTADHPFWVDQGDTPGAGTWLAAGQLQAGDPLRTASGHDVYSYLSLPELAL